MPNRPTNRHAALAELGLRALDADARSTLDAYAVQTVARALGAGEAAYFSVGKRGVALRATTGRSGAAPLELPGPLAERVLEEGEPVPVQLPAHDGRPARDGLAVRIGAAGEPAGLLLALSPAPWTPGPEDPGFLAAVGAVLAGAHEHRRTRTALAESTARAQAILETTVDGVVTIDDRGVIESFNPAAERIFGYRAAEVIGRNVSALMPEPYHSEHDGYLQAYHETGRRRIIGIGREVTGQRKDGSTFPLDLAVSEVHLPDRVIFTGFIRDISERRTLEQAVLRIAEEERRRIGQDLHDGLGQMLTGTALIARGLARSLAAAGAPQAEDADEVVQLIKEADTYARGLARGLVPVELESGGLSAALERLAATAERLLGVQCALQAHGTPPPALPETAAPHLFRIAQEAVSNAARHGRASRVTISLAYGPERLRLRVEDDGVGIDAETAADASVPAPVRPDDHRGMGVRIMHYRARVIGGALEIRPGAEGGTVVTCSLPLQHRSPTDHP